MRLPNHSLFSTVFCATALRLASETAHASKGPLMLPSSDLAMGTTPLHAPSGVRLATDCL